MSPRRALAWSLLPLLLAGCGGSSHHSSTPVSSTDTVGPQIALAWPARARGFAAPSAATAALITFPGVGANGTDLTQVVARPDGAAAVTKTYQLGIAVHPGRHLLRVDFLADTSSTSVPLATATVNVQVTSDGGLRTLDGKNLGTVAYDSNVTALTVASGQTVEVGKTADLVVTATTAGGVVALKPGSISFTLASGAGTLTLNANGSVTGVATGTATLTATVDGSTSAVESVTVLPAPIAARSVSVSTLDLVPDPSRGTVWVALAGGIASLDPTTGTLGSVLGLGAGPSSLAISDDGTTLYASLQTLGTVRRVDLTSNTPGASFPIPSSGFGGAGYAADLALQPGSVSTLAVVRHDAADSGYDGPIVFDDGVARPNSLGIYAASRSLWISTDRLIAYPANFGGFQDVSVDSQGATTTRTVGTQADLSSRLVLAGGRLYAANGIVADATTLASIGAFTQTPVTGSPTTFRGPAIDASRSLAYFVEFSYTENSARLHVYSTSTFAEISNRQITGVSFSQIPNDTRLTLIGSDRLIFRLYDQVVLLDVAGL